MQTSMKVGSIVLSILVVAGIAFAVIRLAPSSRTVPRGASEFMDKQRDEAMMKNEATNRVEPMIQAGSYQAYAPEKLAQAQNGNVVLFFRATWCPTCRALDADIRAHLSDIPDGLTILDVNYDDSSALKQKYGVTYQHTFVQVDAEGNQIAKWSGSPTLSALVTQVK